MIRDSFDADPGFLTTHTYEEKHSLEEILLQYLIFSVNENFVAE